MPNIKELLMSDFLNADAVKGLKQPVGKIKEAGELKKNKYDRYALNVPIQTTAGDLIWTLNQTSLKNLSEEWGEDSEDWVGKYVRFEVEKVRVAGKATEMIVAYPVNDTKENPKEEHQQELKEAAKKVVDAVNEDNPEEDNIDLDDIPF